MLSSCSKKIYFDYEKLLNDSGKVEFKDSIKIVSKITYYNNDYFKVEKTLISNLDENILDLNLSKNTKGYNLIINKSAEKDFVRVKILNWMNNNKIKIKDSNNLIATYYLKRIVCKKSKIDSCNIFFDLKKSIDGKIVFKINNIQLTVNRDKRDIEELYKIPMRRKKKISRIIKKEIINKIQSISGCYNIETL